MFGRVSKILLFLFVLIMICATIFAVFWWRGSSLQTVFTDTATIQQPAEEAHLRDILWRPPEEIPSPIDTDEDEYEPCLSPDGMVLVFVRGKAGQNADLFSSTRTTKGWSSPMSITSINTDADELGPEFSPDGNSLYFYANRTGGQGGYDLWVTHRSHVGWNKPINLGSAVNSPFNDYGPGLSPDGKTLYFSSNRPQATDNHTPDPESWSATVREDLFNRDYDIYASSLGDGQFGDPQSIKALNSVYHEGAPAVSPVGDFIYFSSNRPGGEGGFDLYRVRLFPEKGKSDVYGEVENLGLPVNSVANELDPDLGMGGFRLHFSSDRVTADRVPPESGDYNLYLSTSREVFAETEMVQADIDWLGLWRQLEDPLFWLLLALLALLLLLLLWRLAREDRLGRLGLIARCLIVSVIAHVLVLVLLTFWMVGSSLSDWINEGRGTRVVLLSASVGEGISRQVRGDLTQISVPVRDPSDSVPVEAGSAEPFSVDAITLKTPQTAIKDEVVPLQLTAIPVRNNQSNLPEVHTIPETAVADKATMNLPPRLIPDRVEESKSLLPPPAFLDSLKTRIETLATREFLNPESRLIPVPQVFAESGQFHSQAPLPLADAAPDFDHRPVTPVQVPFDHDLSLPAAEDITVARQDETPFQVEGTMGNALPIDTRSLTISEFESPDTVDLPLPTQQRKNEIPLTTVPPEQVSSDSPLPNHALPDDLTVPMPSTEVAIDLPGMPAKETPNSSESMLAWSQSILPENKPPSTVLHSSTLETPESPDFSTALPIEINENQLARPRHEEIAPALSSTGFLPDDSIHMVESPSVSVVPEISIAGLEERVSLQDPAKEMSIVPPLLTPPPVSRKMDELALESTGLTTVFLVPRGEAKPESSVLEFLYPQPPIRLSEDSDTLAKSDSLSLIVPYDQGQMPLPLLEELSTTRRVEAQSLRPDTRGMAEDNALPQDSPDEYLLDLPPPEYIHLDPLRVTQPDSSFPRSDFMHPAPSFPPPDSTIPDLAPGIPAIPLSNLLLSDSLDFTLPTQILPPPNPYEQRAPDQRRELVKEMGGSEETEKAVADALDWLARHQHESGRWDGMHYDDDCGRCEGRSRIDVHIALTGLSLLAFLAADHTHDKDGPYRKNVQIAVDWLLAHQSEDGSLLGDETMYSHGIASIALAEAYGMTGDQRLKDPVQRAVNFIYSARNTRIGGWRYGPGEVGDTSVMGWQIMALESARRAGLDVPEEAFAVARDWMKLVEHPRKKGLYAYQPRRPVSPAMTAECMFVNQLINSSTTSQPMQFAADYLLENLPDWESGPNTYYWYYATMALFQHHTDAWTQWNETIKEVLLSNQQQNGRASGSWNPEGQWAKVGGRVYQTAICTLTLEVYYRYLPHFMKEKGAS